MYYSLAELATSPETTTLSEDTDLIMLPTSPRSPRLNVSVLPKDAGTSGHTAELTTPVSHILPSSLAPRLPGLEVMKYVLDKV